MVYVTPLVAPTTDHDIESLIWATIYAIYKHAYSQAQDPARSLDENDREMIIEAYEGDFDMNMNTVALRHHRWHMACGGLSNLSFIYSRLADNIGELVVGMLMLVGRQYHSPWPTEHVLRKYLGEAADDLEPISAGHLERLIRAWITVNLDGA